jgi:uncharacterized membrane protein YfcA
MIDDPLFYALAIPAALIAGISKGGFGSGLGLIAVPMMALIVPVPMAAAIMLPVLISIDFINIWVYRKDFSAGDLKFLLPGAVLGTLIGWAGFHFMTEAGTRLMVGLIAIVFTLDHWLPIRPKPDGARPPGPRGVFWGMCAGFTSFFAHAGAPPMQVYLLPRGLSKRAYVGTFAVFFWAVNLMKVPAYWNLDQFTSEVLLTALVLVPFVPLGIRIGLWGQTRLSDKMFFGVCYVLLFLTGVKLTWDGVAGMLG